MRLCGARSGHQARFSLGQAGRAHQGILIPLDYWIALAMINAMPPTTEMAMNVPAAKSQISVFEYSAIGSLRCRFLKLGHVPMPTFAIEVVI